MTEIKNWLTAFSGDWAWAVSVFMVVLGTGVASFFLKRLLSRMLRRMGRTDTQWDDVFFEAMRRPVTWGVWLIGLDIAVDIVYAQTDNVIFSYSDPIRNVGVLICVTWFLLGLIRGGEAELGRDAEQVDRHTAEAIGKLLRLTVLITAGLVILQTMGFSISGVLAMGGIGGIAIGFAAKDLLANFFGAMIIYLDRPFTVGDWIRSPDRSIEGTVEKIGWRLTVIRDFQSRPLYVPNSIFTAIIVENPSRMANRRIYETIGLRYDDLENMAKVVDEVKAMLLSHPEVDPAKTMIVNFNDFNDSSLDFFVYCYTRTTQWVKYHEVKQEVMLRIAAIIESHGAQIAYPTSTLHLPNPVTLNSS